MLCERATSTSVAALFGGLVTFSVPPFQRVFAWEEPSVMAFLADIERCYLKRRDDQAEAHFFGSVVTGPLNVSGAVRPHRQVLDGQQRLAMFALFIAALADDYLLLAGQCAVGEADIAKALTSRSRQMRSRYLVSEELDFFEVRELYSLSLNQADDPFFKALLRGEVVAAEIDSHRRLASADSAIRGYLREKREAAFDDVERREALNRLYRALVEDWELVHIEAGSAKQASQIFRVLNNRGVPVSACDLLRATTLEACYRKLEDAEFAELKDAWTDMTSLEKLASDDALDIVQKARFPKDEPASRTSTNFEASFFPQLSAGLPLINEGARELLSAVKLRRDDFMAADRMARGELLPPPVGAFSSVEESLYNSLLGELDQYWLLPAMLAARALGLPHQKKFLLDLALFAFRYRVACRGPIAPFERMIRHSIDQLNVDPGRFRCRNFAEDLRELIADHANDETFARALKDLSYTSDKKAIRFLLAMDEYTLAWFEEGAKGRPDFRSPDQGIDLSQITLEHVSAQNPEEVEPDMRPLVHTLGNLTLLAEGENVRARNRKFEEKRDILKASNLRMNLTLAELEAWDEVKISERQDEIVRRAMRVFSLDHSQQ